MVALARCGALPPAKAAKAVRDLGIDPDKVDPARGLTRAADRAACRSGPRSSARPDRVRGTGRARGPDADELVRRRRWLDDAAFLDLLGARTSSPARAPPSWRCTSATGGPAPPA